MQLSSVILRGSRAAQPDANSVAAGTVYYVTDESVTERSTGSAWEDISDGGSGVSDHGALTGLDDDDHSAVYPLITNFESDRATLATNWDDLTDGGETTLHSHAGGASSETDQALEDASLSNYPDVDDVSPAPVSLGLLGFKFQKLDDNFSLTTQNETFENITGFNMAVGANERWLFEIYLAIVSSGETADFKFASTFPSNSTQNCWINGPSTSATSYVVATSARWSFFPDISSGTSFGNLGGDPDTNGMCRIMLELATTDTAGTWQLQTAQNTSSTQTCTIVAGSFFIARQVG